MHYDPRDMWSTWVRALLLVAMAMAARAPRQRRRSDDHPVRSEFCSVTRILSQISQFVCSCCKCRYVPCLSTNIQSNLRSSCDTEHTATTGVSLPPLRYSTKNLWHPNAVYWLRYPKIILAKNGMLFWLLTYWSQNMMNSEACLNPYCHCKIRAEVGTTKEMKSPSSALHRQGDWLIVQPLSNLVSLCLV